jgi:type IV secretory pathway TrbD component
MRRRLVLQTALALASGILAALTLVDREWIEAAFGVDPDAGSGALEWIVAATCAVAAAACGTAAAIELRRGFRRA